MGVFEGIKTSVDLPAAAGNLKCWTGKVVIKEQTFFFFLTESIPQKKVGFEGFLKIRHRSKGVVETCSHLQQVPDVVKKAILHSSWEQSTMSVFLW